MRRAERAVTALTDILGILGHCDVCRLGFVDAGEVYIVPLNFGYRMDDGQLSLFFHGATAGRKYEALKERRVISFELDTAHQLIENENPCEYSFAYESVMGTGEITMLVDDADRADALSQFMRHVSGKDFSFEGSVPPRVAVYRLVVRDIIGKRHIAPGRGA